VTFWRFHHFPILALLRSHREKGKKGGRNTREISAVPTQQIGGEMKRKKTKRKQQGCDVAKVIDTVEQAVSTARRFIGLSSQW
jgi:primase-polymerase (primpol)-like protein